MSVYYVDCNYNLIPDVTQKSRMASRGRFANTDRGRNGGRGRGGGRFPNNKPDKNKSKNADLYVNGVFKGRNKDYPVVRASSKNQAYEFQEM